MVVEILKSLGITLFCTILIFTFIILLFCIAIYINPFYVLLILLFIEIFGAVSFSMVLFDTTDNNDSYNKKIAHAKHVKIKE